MDRIKVLGVSASPRTGKNTEQLLRKTLEGCERASAEIEIFSVSNKNLNPCKGCSACKTVGKCPIKDDITELFEKMKEADVILMGSPIFFYDVTSQCKTIIDRSYVIQPLNQNKIGGILLTTGLRYAQSLRLWNSHKINITSTN